MSRHDPHFSHDLSMSQASGSLGFCAQIATQIEGHNVRNFEIFFLNIKEREVVEVIFCTWEKHSQQDCG